MVRTFNLLLALATLTGASAATAQSFTLELEIPRLEVAEYHRPYAAIWIAEQNNSVATNLAVLYDVEMKDQEGEKWLKDMRQWWRRSGRSLEMPIDGLSGATRGPGTHNFDFSDKVANLPSNKYRLMVEVAREVGGRELIEIPFQWPPIKNQEQNSNGEEELGNVLLRLAP